MHILDVAKWNAVDNETLACKFITSSHDDRFNTKSRLIVSTGQEAVVVINGKMTGPFKPCLDGHTMNTKNLPILTDLWAKLMYSGETPYPAEIWFVPVSSAPDFGWGTPVTFGAEYNSNGIPTGKSMNIPEEFSKNNIQGNYGFESLAYSAATNQFWTTTENALKKDIGKPDEGVRLRLQSFDDNLMTKHQYEYRTDSPVYGNKKKRNYAFGVAEICALADSSLIVLEREFIVTSNYIGSKCNHKLFVVKPTKNDVSMEKNQLYSFETKLSLSHTNLANYEGMCLGARLSDGKQTLLLVNDSQAGAGNKIFALQDYLKVISISYPREAE